MSAVATSADSGAETDRLVLYEPPVEHSLLYERAECSAVRFLLNVSGLRGKYTVQQRLNVHSMSSTGLVPLLAVGNTQAYAGLREIDGYLHRQAALAALSKSAKLDQKGSGSNLTNGLSDKTNGSEDSNDQKLTEAALRSLLRDTLHNCEHFIEWQVDRASIERNLALIYAAPLDFLVARRRKQDALHYERPLCLTTRTIAECLLEANDALSSLSWQLRTRSKDGREPEFYSDKPGLIDALVYGHFDALLNPTYKEKTDESGKSQLRKVFERPDFENLRRLHQAAIKRYID